MLTHGHVGAPDGREHLAKRFLYYATITEVHRIWLRRCCPFSRVALQKGNVMISFCAQPKRKKGVTKKLGTESKPVAHVDRGI